MITLKYQDLDFMIKVLPLSEAQKKKLDTATGKLKIEISDDLADSLRDLCSERLDEHGFDENYDPTPEGKKLEELIDKLFVC
jgi:hypothetical protein